jgi:hypothetical protein
VRKPYRRAILGALFVLATVLTGALFWSQARASAASATNGWRLRELARGVQLYVDDWAVIPALNSPSVLRTQLGAPKNYVRSTSYYADVAGRLFAGSPALAGRPMRSRSATRQVLFYECAPESDGSRLVAFMGGYVRRVSGDEWESLRRDCGGH